MYPNQTKFNTGTVPKTILNFNQVFTMGKFLGEGSFSQTYQVIDKKSSKVYALKILKTMDDDTIKEIQMLIALSKNASVNKDIVKYYDHFLHGDKFCILMEYIDGQQADHYFQRTRFTFSTFLKFSIWLCDTIARLHAINIVHRDIKPANILVTKNSYKLIDFGFSCRLTKFHNDLLKCNASVAGTPVFMAPELWNQKFIVNIDKYLKTADVWAVGVTLYFLLSGEKLPYPINQQGRALVQKYHPIQLKRNQLNDIFQRMTLFNADRRWTASQSMQALKKIVLI